MWWRRNFCEGEWLFARLVKVVHESMFVFFGFMTLQVYSTLPNPQ